MGGSGPPLDNAKEERPVNPKEMLSLKEASLYLSMDEAALQALASERRIPSMELDGQWVFSKKSIDKWRTQTQSARR